MKTGLAAMVRSGADWISAIGAVAVECVIRNNVGHDSEDQRQAKQCYGHPFLRRQCPPLAADALSYVPGLRGQELDQR
jgi:hypothetical protein